MSKIIIDNQSSAMDLDVIDCVKSVIAMGRVSNHGKQYCYASLFETPHVAVYADLNRLSDKFTIVDQD